MVMWKYLLNIPRWVNACDIIRFKKHTLVTYMLGNEYAKGMIYASRIVDGMRIYDIYPVGFYSPVFVTENYLVSIPASSIMGVPWYDYYSTGGCSTLPHGTLLVAHTWALAPAILLAAGSRWERAKVWSYDNPSAYIYPRYIVNPMYPGALNFNEAFDDSIIDMYVRDVDPEPQGSVVDMRIPPGTNIDYIDTIVKNGIVMSAFRRNNTWMYRIRNESMDIVPATNILRLSGKMPTLNGSWHLPTGTKVRYSGKLGTITMYPNIRQDNGTIRRMYGYPESIYMNGGETLDLTPP